MKDMFCQYVCRTYVDMVRIRKQHITTY